MLKITYRIDLDACLQIIVFSAPLLQPTSPPEPTVDLSTLMIPLLVIRNPPPPYNHTETNPNLPAKRPLTYSPSLLFTYQPYLLMVVVGCGSWPG